MHGAVATWSLETLGIFRSIFSQLLKSLARAHPGDHENRLSFIRLSDWCVQNDDSQNEILWSKSMWDIAGANFRKSFGNFLNFWSTPKLAASGGCLVEQSAPSHPHVHPSGSQNQSLHVRCISASLHSAENEPRPEL